MSPRSFRGRLVRRRSGFVVLVASALFLAPTVIFAAPSRSLANTSAGDEEHGVFVRLVTGAGESIDAVTETLIGSLTGAGWEILAIHDTSRPATECSFGARVIVIYSPGYAQTLAPYGSHAAFAVPIRIAVFEDEEGVHIGSTNILNLNRTIVDERVPSSAWLPWSDRVTNVVTAAFPQATTARDYGQFRKKGRIGKTLGIMAGGPFPEKIETIVTVPGSTQTVEEVVSRLQAEFGGIEGDWEWGLAPVYAVNVAPNETAILGVSGARVEADAFRIVGKGSDNSRKEMACPGIDHAPAFPIEVLVTRVGEEIQVQLVDEMYRMKMFFEDAGKIAFAKNMGMPGSIEDEIKQMVRAVLR